MAPISSVVFASIALPLLSRSAPAPAPVVILRPADFIIPGDGAGSLSAGCMEAMQAAVACDSYFDPYILKEWTPALENARKDDICTDACAKSMAEYQGSVEYACAGSSWLSTPAGRRMDRMVDVHAWACMRDTQGNYCEDVARNLYMVAPDLTALSALSNGGQCAECVIMSAEKALSGGISESELTFESLFKDYFTQIQMQCNTTPELMVQGSVFKRDTPEAVSDTSISARCSHSHTVEAGDTCWKIGNRYSVTLSQLRTWNTFINPSCTNLVVGDQLCVSQPSTTAEPSSTVTATSTTSTTNWATATVAPPGPVARGTTPRCGKYYLVRSGDYCQRITHDNNIAMDLFRAINPDINTECTNLIAGLHYCVLPTADWNDPTPTTTSSTTTPPVYANPPGPTSSGSTARCYEWYVVQSGDYCGRLQTKFKITMAQLQLWNPELNRECTNLLLGYAYCIRGDSETATVPVRVGAMQTA